MRAHYLMPTTIHSKGSGIAIALALASVIGCAHREPRNVEATQENPAPKIAPKSNGKFAKLHPGMTIKQVNVAIGMPDDTDSHESGKRWIPFYFGNDARRLEALYQGEGCLTFAGGNIWGANAEGELKEIHVDPSGSCFRH
jgi:hypothetical protein